MKLVERDRRPRRRTSGLQPASPLSQRGEDWGEELFWRSGLQSVNPHPTLSLAKGEANQARSQAVGDETRSRPLKRRNRFNNHVDDCNRQRLRTLRALLRLRPAPPD